jgi:agmatine deiminase
VVLPPGSRLPPDHVRHERTLVAWPTERRRADLWHDQLDAARDDHAEIARALVAHEPVTMIADEHNVADARQRCGPHVDVLALPIDDSWIRDSGPLVVLAPDGARCAVHFGFNAWGRKFEEYAGDAAVGRAVAEHLGLPVVEAPIILEGGSIAIDAAGRLVTTERCLLNPNRNPGLSRAQLESALCEWLGVTEVVWLPDGIREDDGTDGHVDNVVAFTPSGRVLLQGCDDPENPNHAIASENRKRLEQAGFEVVEVAVLPYAAIDGTRVPVPYVNFYAANGVVVVPTTGHAADADALAIIGEHYPGREVVAVPGAVLAYGGGGVHCVTQQVPAGSAP